MSIIININITTIRIKINIYKNFKVIACSDIDIDFAKKSAEKFNVKAQSVEDLLSNSEIDLIINLTIPSAHKKVIINSLNAGKHCFSEKPLAINFNEGKEIHELSKQKKLLQELLKKLTKNKICL